MDLRISTHTHAVVEAEGHTQHISLFPMVDLGSRGRLLSVFPFLGHIWTAREGILRAALRETNSSWMEVTSDGGMGLRVLSNRVEGL